MGIMDVTIINVRTYHLLFMFVKLHISVIVDDCENLIVILPRRHIT